LIIEAVKFAGSVDFKSLEEMFPQENMIKLARIKQRLGFGPQGWEAVNFKRFKKLGGNYRGKRCFIMGNGPSLNETPLELLDGEFIFGVNRCHLLYDRVSWRPSFFTAVDGRVTPNISGEIFEQAKQLPDTCFFLPAHFRDIQPWQNQSNIIWMNEKLQDPALGPDGYFASCPPDFVRVPNTVTITCIQLAVFLGFNPIYLIGCDTKYVIPEGMVSSEGSVRDPGTGELIEGFALTMLLDQDPNHFDPDYFRKGDPWSSPNVNGMVYGYNMVKRKCQTLGTTIYNGTVGGELEVFPRVDINRLLG